MTDFVERTPITEEQEDVWKGWFSQASKQTVDTLPEFMRHVMNDYTHDYGTVVHAVASCAVAAAWAADKADLAGGITGFQASFVMWDFIKFWAKETNKTGMKLVDYDNMLYPQYKERFEKTISPGVWESLQEQAKKNITEAEKGKHAVHPDVMKHWRSIVAGNVPFGYVVKEG